MPLLGKSGGAVPAGERIRGYREEEPGRVDTGQGRSRRSGTDSTRDPGNDAGQGGRHPSGFALPLRRMEASGDPRRHRGDQDQCLGLPAHPRTAQLLHPEAPCRCGCRGRERLRGRPGGAPKPRLPPGHGPCKRQAHADAPLVRSRHAPEKLHHVRPFGACLISRARRGSISW
jgi:hypothetical protein